MQTYESCVNKLNGSVSLTVLFSMSRGDGFGTDLLVQITAKLSRQHGHFRGYYVHTSGQTNKHIQILL